MVPFISNLDELRERIKGIDYSIMSLIAQRLNLGKQVGRLKLETGLPVRNYQVEKMVYNRIFRYSTEFNLEYEFMNKIFEQIIEQSVEAQLLDRNIVGKSEFGKKCLVIGGAGKMGDWFVNFLVSSGHQVDIVDPILETSNGNFKQLPESLDKYEIIIVSAPLRKMNEVLIEVISRNPTGIIFEIGSLKSEIIDLIKKANDDGIKLISIHPMFGPTVKHLAGRNLLICTGTSHSDEIKISVDELFADTLLNIVYVELDKHDHHMLHSLGLSHFVNLLMGIILSKSELKFKQIQNFAGTTFNKQIMTTKEVFNENPELYYSIQKVNSFKDELYSMIQETSKEIIDMVTTQDENDFYELMKLGRNYFKSE